MQEMIREKKRQKIEQKTQASKENPNSYYSYKRRAELRAELGEYEAALDDIEKAIELAPDNGFLFGMKAKKDNILKKIRKKEYKESAKSKMELGEYEAALDDLQKALYIQPDDKEIKQIKETVLLRIKEKKEAENLKNKK
ncbi:MAG: tetratricopeptide repeat protein [bacterium]